jgi:hypothetical protein
LRTDGIEDALLAQMLNEKATSPNQAGRTGDEREEVRMLTDAYAIMVIGSPYQGWGVFFLIGRSNLIRVLSHWLLFLI